MPNIYRNVVGFSLLFLAGFAAFAATALDKSDQNLRFALIAIALVFAYWMCYIIEPLGEAARRTAACGKWTVFERTMTFFVSVVAAVAWIPALGVVMREFSVTVPVYGYTCTVWFPGFVVRSVGFFEMFGAAPGTSLILAILAWGIVVWLAGFSLAIIANGKVGIHQARLQKSHEDFR